MDGQSINGRRVCESRKQRKGNPEDMVLSISKQLTKQKLPKPPWMDNRLTAVPFVSTSLGLKRRQRAKEKGRNKSRRRTLPILVRPSRRRLRATAKPLERSPDAEET